MGVKWLLVGAGDIVKSRVAAALSQADNSEIVAIFAPSIGKAEKLAEEYRIPKVYHDFALALSECDAGCVYIAAPQRFHVELAKQSLKAGRHFLCEKPLGIRSDECLELYEYAKQFPRLKTSCSNYRLMTRQFITTKRMIDDGEIGKLLCGWVHDEEPHYNPSGEPLLKEKGKSPVLEFGFYSLNMAQHLFGMPESVIAVSASFNTKNLIPYDVHDLSSIVLRYPGGEQFTLFLNQASQAPLRHSCEFCGASGRILWPECPPHFNSPVTRIDGGGSRVIPDSVTPVPNGQSKPNWHLPMVQDFVDSVINDRRPFCTLESAVHTAVVTEAVFRSMESGMPERVGT